MEVFVLLLRSDVMGVEVFLFTPTVSGDVTVPCFCVSLSSSSQRFSRYTLKTLSPEFPENPVFNPLSLLTVKTLGSHGGVGWELRRLYEIFILSSVWSGESWSELEMMGEKW